MRFLSIGFILLLLIALASGCSHDPVEVQTPESIAEQSGAAETPVLAATAEPSVTPLPSLTPSPVSTATPVPTPTPAYETLGLVLVDLPALLEETLQARLEALDLRDAGYLLDVVSEAQADLAVRLAADGPSAKAESLGQVVETAWRVYVPVVPFDTVRDAVSLDELHAHWAEGSLVVSEETADVLTAMWGAGQPQIVAPSDILAELAANRQAVAVVPFDELAPTLKVLYLEGQSPFDQELAPAEYGLAVALWLEGDDAAGVGPLLDGALDGWANRDTERMTELIMTGVTAMCRLTADRMERYGMVYPARVVSDVLRAADITHVSNEVPFIKDCPVNTASGNLTFCSDYPYWEALEAVGTDIVGLSGNHVNDYGYEGARESIAFYRDRGIPIYGSGLNEEEACAPLFMEHNGNRLAFIATLAFEPSYAWATEDLPGACYFYNNKERLTQLIVDLKADPEVDLVAIELQYLETYYPYPTEQQVVEFRELSEAGADIVTGAQSHVPQSWEPYDASNPNGPSIIVYGLGNFFFDQMWSWQTRTGLIARHMIYEGRLLNSEVLTTVLEDYAQPRWATADEREGILRSIFDAAPARPAPAPVASDD